MISFILIVVINSPGIARGAGLVCGALDSLVARSDKAFLHYFVASHGALPSRVAHLESSHD